jgi:hypothetical protein
MICRPCRPSFSAPYIADGRVCRAMRRLFKIFRTLTRRDEDPQRLNLD